MDLTQQNFPGHGLQTRFKITLIPVEVKNYHLELSSEDLAWARNNVVEFSTQRRKI